MMDTVIYWGEREDMIAEIAAWDPRNIEIPEDECRYLVVAQGEGQADAEWFATREEAREHAQLLATELGVRICAV